MNKMGVLSGLKGHAVLSAMVSFVVLTSAAETVTWTGSASSDWSTAANWTSGSGAKVPAAGDVVVIGAGKAVLSAATPRLKSVTVSGAVLEFREASKAAPSDLVTKLSADAVSLEQGAVVTHITNTMTRAEFNAEGEWKMDGRVWIDCETLTIDATSAIDVTSRGYAQFAPSTLGVGPGSVTNTYGCFSAAHGGMGAVGHHDVAWHYRWYSPNQFCGLPYGEAAAPVWAGSSGSCSASSKMPGWAGGGAVKIDATGRVTVNGAIHADSTGAFAGTYACGGSGGSVWIECGSIAGSGAITADGGQGGEASTVSYAGYNYAYAGGGGRVAVHYDPAAQDAVTAQSLRFSADAPCRAKKDYTSARIVNPPNDVGTVHFTDDRFLTDTFTATVGVSAGEIRCASWTKWQPASLTVNGAWIRLPEGPATNLTLSGALTVSGVGRLDIGGGMQHYDSRDALTVPPWQRYSCAAAPNLSVASLEVSNSGCLRLFAAATNGLDGAIGALLAVRGDMLVGDNAQVVLGSHPYCGAPPHVTVGGNATVTAKGRLDANGQGFFGTESNQNGRGPGYGWAVSGTVRQAASHGGLGAYHSGWGETICSSTTYGDLTRPTTAGSSAWFSGGGVVWLTVGGHLQFDGVATANSQVNWAAHVNWYLTGHPTGAGGSICLESNTVGGKGELRASAALTYSYDRLNSGGGRIAVRYDPAAEADYLKSNPKPTFLYEASPVTRAFQDEATAKQVPGDMGTIYLTDAQLMTNVFTTANFRYGEIHLGDWSSWNVGDVTVDGSSIRLHGDGETIRIGGTVRILGKAFLGFGGGAYSRRSFRYLAVGEDQGFAAMRLTKGPGPRVEIGGDVEIGAGAQVSPYYYNDSPRLAVYAGDEIAVGNWNLGGSFVVAGDLKVRDTGVYELVSHSESGTVVRTEVKNLIVDAGGKVDASYRGGRCGRHSDERGAPMLAGGKGGGYYSCGGGYGGDGGKCYGNEVTGLAYGDAMCPTNMGGGSGPFGYDGTLFDGFGGGCIWIEAKRKMSLAGKVLANGCGSGHTYAASGAGGGIFLKCRIWDPDPSTLKISADGGQRVDSNYADGGGGRVAIWRTIDLEEESDPTVSSADDQGRGYVSVWASEKGSKRKAMPGTIRWKTFGLGLMLFVK